MGAMGKLQTRLIYFIGFLINIFISATILQPSPKYLVWPVILRVVFIPLFIFCNYQPMTPTRVLPVYINNDLIYWTIAVIMSFSSGYLSSLAMMYAPRAQTTPMHQIKAGMMAAAMLISGIFAGIMFSFLPPIFIKYSF